MEKREKEILPSILRDGHWQGEVAFSIRSKSIVALQNSFLVRDEQGNPAFLATVLTDITERKRVEEALRQSHDELRTIYDGIIEGVLITDVETKRFVHANYAMCRMLGYRNRQAPVLTGLATVVEFHYTTTLNDADSISGPVGLATFGNLANRMDIPNLTVGIHSELANHTLVRVGGVFPLSTGDNRWFDAEVQAQVERRF